MSKETQGRILELINELGLIRHPEGGFYKETYRSSEKTDGGAKDLATSIYYLLSMADFSSLHRIKQDENWYFHEGGTLFVHDISPDGVYIQHKLGMDITAGESPQCTIPAGHWFGASLKDPTSYVLVGCVVAPGFEFDDLELGERGKLMSLFPQHGELVQQLTR